MVAGNPRPESVPVERAGGQGRGGFLNRVSSSSRAGDPSLCVQTISVQYLAWHPDFYRCLSQAWPIGGRGSRRITMGPSRSPSPILTPSVEDPLELPCLASAPERPISPQSFPFQFQPPCPRPACSLPCRIGRCPTFPGEVAAAR